MSRLINKMKDSMSKDKNEDAEYSTTSPSQYTAPHGTHVSNDPTRDSAYGSGAGYGNQSRQSNESGYDNPQSANYGPHSSNLANKTDPRVDSDLSKSQRTSGQGYDGYDNQRTTVGPHSSNLANKADPRVDSDLSKTQRTGQGYDGYDNPQSANVGPHSSNLANRADPRVDSDMSKTNRNYPSGTAGSGNNYSSGTAGSNNNYSSGTTGSNYPSGTTGSGNNYSNDRDNRDYAPGTATSTGYGGNNNNANRKEVPTTGPHNSSLLNKIDPRVDSDRDGSRTSGTSNSNSGTGNKNLVPGIANTKDHSTHSSGAGTTQHDTMHRGEGKATSNVETTSGAGSKFHDSVKHSTRHEGGGTYESSASHSSGPGHHDKSTTQHSGPGVHESNVQQDHDQAGGTTSTTHTSTHMSGY